MGDHELVKEFDEALRARGLPDSASVEGLCRHERSHGSVLGAIHASFRVDAWAMRGLADRAREEIAEKTAQLPVGADRTGFARGALEVIQLIDFMAASPSDESTGSAMDALGPRPESVLAGLAATLREAYDPETWDWGKVDAVRVRLENLAKGRVLDAPEATDVVTETPVRGV